MKRFLVFIITLSFTASYFFSSKGPSKTACITGTKLNFKQNHKIHLSVVRYQKKEKNENKKELEFDKILSNLLKELPQKNQIQSLSSEEVHHTPDIILSAGKKLGALREAISKSKNDPNIRAKSFLFYKRCAFNLDFLKSVRTLCFIHAKEIDHNINAPSDIKQLILISKLGVKS